MKTIKLDLGKRSYKIVAGHNASDRLGPLLSALKIGSHAMVITNPTIGHLYKNKFTKQLKASGLDVRVEMVPDSETSKSYGACLKLINKLADYDGLGKRLFLIALGGGVIGDLTGFVAAIYKRGIPYVQVPTTLLGQVDSAIGGKVAIDLSYGKNLVGAFYQPRLVLSDISYLNSLSIRQIRSGLSEIIKYGIISDKALFEYIEKNFNRLMSLNIECLQQVITRCSQIKAKVVESDEQEKSGKRAVLNFGHTVGHAIEAACGYSASFTHGEAVALGMISAAEISHKMKLLKKDELIRVTALCEKVTMSAKVKGLTLNKIMKALYHDKKFINGKTRFVLLSKIGKVKIVEDVPESLIKRVVKKQCSL